jgi:hypothetical protein
VKEVEEPCALEEITRQRNVVVMEPDKKPIQLPHCFGEIKAVCVILAQLTTEEIVPRALIEFAADTPFVVDPEAKVRISACKMVEQFLCLLS